MAATSNDTRRRPGRTGDEGGFTLIELMVVVLIIGVLISIALPTYLGTRQRASNRAAQSELRTALAAALTYWAELGSFDGFDVSEGERAEPTLAWVSPGPPATGEIAIEVASGGQLLLVGESRTGGFFCLAQHPNSPATSHGAGSSFSEVDTVLECDGGW